jgi:hypothetical protein
MTVLDLSVSRAHMQTQNTNIDHLVIGAANLEQGVAFVRECMGVDVPFGGIHEKMATHNHLMQLGGGVFLEVISVNHETEPPNRPRWYGLDDLYVRKQIEIQPMLLTWVVNTRNIHKLIQQATFKLGEPELLNRGDIKWYFSLPEDGRLLASGILPYAIEWHTKNHPSQRMADLGCRLLSLEVYHSNIDWLMPALDSIGVMSLVKVNALNKNEAPYLKAKISTPHGIKVLSNRM